MARDVYADGKRRCKAAFEEVMKHKAVIDKFRQAVSDPFQIRKADYDVDNLWRIMLLDIHSRSGPRFDACRVADAKSGFCSAVKWQALRNLRPEEQFSRVYRGLTGSRQGFGPKITAVFMRQMVCEYDIFPGMKPHLFLPVDRHIQSILCEKLEAFRPEQVTNQNVLSSTTAMEFQDTIRDQIHFPRVELDVFWHVGYLFCNMNSTDVCRDVCWMREFCQSRSV